MVSGAELMFKASSYILLVAFVLSLHAVSANTNTILIIGDSLSAEYGINKDTGWAHLLSDKIIESKKPYKVINSSISGDTSISGKNRLAGLLTRYKPAIVIIELGGNDGLRGLSLKSLKSNLSEMIEMSRQQQSKVVLAGIKIPPNYGERYTTAFYKIYEDLADQYSINLIPFLLEGIADKPALMQSDGIHPAQKAQPLILNIVWKVLEEML